jgi:archaellum biogenesis ATPase FlaH
MPALGMAAVCGAVSGGLECLDFDELGYFEQWVAEVIKEVPNLFELICMVETPSGGNHVWYRADHVSGNKPLARRPASEAELKVKPEQKSYVLIETRGEGGYAIIPGSCADAHEDHKEYRYSISTLTQVKKITDLQRSIFLRVASSFDQLVEDRQINAEETARSKSLRVGDDFEMRASWRDILEPHGWRLDSGTWERGRLTRPGKDRGCSATIGYAVSGGVPLLKVFTSSAGIDPGAYGKFRAYAHLNHRSDYSATARDLSLRGYGVQNSPSRGPQQRKHDGQPQQRLPEETTANGAAAPQKTKPQPKKQSFSTLKVAESKIVNVNWLVHRKIPAGKMVLLAGEGGMGKSTLVRHLIAKLTTGQPAFGLNYEPDGPCDVLLVSVEDSLSDTVAPHLLAEGADCNRVHFVTGTNDPDTQKPRPVDLREIEPFETFIEANPACKLIVIDPIMSFISRAGINEAKASDVRYMLDPLIDLAERTNVTVMLIAHFSKDKQAKASDRIAGAAAFRDACRVAYMFGPHPLLAEQRVMAVVKNNISGLDQSSLAFSRRYLTPDEANEVMQHPQFDQLRDDQREEMRAQLAVIVSHGVTDTTADESASAKPRTVAERAIGRSVSKKQQEAVDWLRQRALGGVRWPDGVLEADAIKHGFSIWEFRRAKTILKTEGYQAKPIGVNWYFGFGDIRTLPEPEAANNASNEEEIPQ